MDEFQIEVERLRNLVMSGTTDLVIQEEHEQEYFVLRKSLLSQERFKRYAPKVIQTCGTLRELKRELQAKGGYKIRREYIKDIFSPYYGEENLADAIEDIVQQINFGELNLLPEDIIKKGREMSDVYIYLYSIENSLRIFVSEIMQDKPITLPRKVQETIDRMKKNEQESKYLPLRGNNDLFYCDFIQLGNIISANWGVFGTFFPNKNEHWINVMIEELYKIRCLVAHNSYVGEHERQSLKVYYRNIIMQLKKE